VRRHDTDATSLVFGLIYVGVVGLWALIASDTMDVPDLSVLGPALLVVAGFIGLAATLGTSSKQRARAAVAERAAADRAAADQAAADQPSAPQQTTLIDDLAPAHQPATDVEPAADPEEGQRSTS
jgi:hypothetical protein